MLRIGNQSGLVWECASGGMVKLMRSAPKLTLLTLVCFCSIASPSPAFVRISLGATNFTIVPSATSMVYSQTPSDLILNGTYTSSSTIGGLFVTPYDWSLLSQTISLQMSINGPNPNLPLSVQLYDSFLNEIAGYQATTFGVGPTTSTVVLTPTSVGTGLFNDVAGVQYSWNGSGSIDANVALQVAPEPSTYALLLAGGIGAACLLRRRRS